MNSVFKKSISFICALAFALTLCSCGTSSAKRTGSKKIVASFYPMYVFTSNLVSGIDNVQVVSMVSKTGGCLHDYQLLPKDMKNLSDADLFVVNGAGMEGFLPDVRSQLPSLTVCTASAGCSLIKNNSADAETQYNSHVWMSVQNAETEVKNISKALIKLMPENKAQIKSNEKDYLNRLADLDSYISDQLAPYKGSRIITFHAAFDYYARDYGLTVTDTIESDDGAEPSAKRLAQLSDKIKKEHIKALFTEPSYKGSAASILSESTGVKVYSIDPVTSGDMSDGSYVSIMKSNTQTIKEALSDAG